MKRINERTVMGSEILMERHQAYGDGLTQCRRIALLWSSILGVFVSAADIPLCMIALKLSREIHKHNPDNLVDIAGYAELGLRIRERLAGGGPAAAPPKPTEKPRNEETE